MYELEVILEEVEDSFSLYVLEVYDLLSEVREDLSSEGW
jgi:hypothetical protein